MFTQRSEKVKAGEFIDLAGFVSEAAGCEGAIWKLKAGEDLNANLVCFTAGQGVGEHVNDELDVVFVGVSGTGLVIVEGNEYELSGGTLVFAPKGSRRSTRSSSEDFSYLTVHRQRGPIQLGGRAR